jgi:hypothetical protein
MAGAEKTNPGSQPNSKSERRSRDNEPKSSSADRQQTRSHVIKEMDTQNRQDTAMVDRWFDRQINQLYADVVSEPLPKEFLELIDKLREKKTPK